MPRKTTYGSLDPETSGGRIAILLRDVWGGNQRKMAEDVGVTQPAISKVVRGDQPPGRRLLELVAADPKVNPDWVLRGVGGPTPAPAPEATGGDWMVPVAGCILPSHPRRHAALFTGARLPVATFYRSESRYLLAVQRGDPVVRAEGERVAPGDHLLMEADRDIWLSNRMVLVGKLVALRLGGERGADYALGRADMNPATRELKFTCFGVLGPPAQADSMATTTASEDSSTSTTGPRPEVGGTKSFVTAPPRGRGVMLSPTGTSVGTLAKTEPILPTPPTEPAPDSRDEVRQVLISISDVVGYCALLIRT